MMDFITSNHTVKNACALCRHVLDYHPAPHPWDRLTTTRYKCTLTGNTVNPLQTPCPLYEPIAHSYPPTPTRPNSHPSPA